MTTDGRINAYLVVCRRLAPGERFAPNHPHVLPGGDVAYYYGVECASHQRTQLMEVRLADLPESR